MFLDFVRWWHDFRNDIQQFAIGTPIELLPRFGDWIVTRTGQKFYTLDPRPSEIFIEDIAESLAKRCRYEGQCKDFYSVAEHSCWCAYAAPPALKLTLLMHDAAEAYMPDVARPTKIGWGAVVRNTEHRLMEAIQAKWPRFRYPFPHLVKVIDNRMLATERKTIITGPQWHKFEYDNPYDFQVQQWEWREARRNWLAYFWHLWHQAGGSTGSLEETADLYPLPDFAKVEYPGLYEPAPFIGDGDAASHY